MAQIVRAEIVGIREAENTHFGLSGNTTYNSTCYSVLVFYDDGSRKLVEGHAKEIEYYLRYMEPSCDLVQIKSIIEEHDEKMMQDLQTMFKQGFQTVIQDEVFRVFESIHPLPNVIGKDEVTAKRTLEESGFTVEMLNDYPPDIPPGVVADCKRKQGAYLTAQLDVQHVLPDISNLSLEQALTQLKQQGFNPVIREVLTPTNKIDNQTLTCERHGQSMNVTIIVSKPNPQIFQLEGLSQNEAKAILEKSNITIDSSTLIYSDIIPIGKVAKVIYPNVFHCELFISNGKQNKYHCENLNISMKNLTDSSGGSAKGNASFDLKARTVLLDISIFQSVNHQHLIYYVESSIDNKKVETKAQFGSSPTGTIDSDKEAKAQLFLQIDDTPLSKDNLPKKATITFYTTVTLNTKFGLLNKKDDSMSLDIEFNWV